MGMDVVPTWKKDRKSTTCGKKYPSPTPRAIARNIHRVRKRSKNGSRLVVVVGFFAEVMAYILVLL